MNPVKPNSEFWSSELGLRVFSAIIMLAIVVTLSWVGGTAFLLLCLILSAFLYYEWQKIVRLTPFDGTEALLTLGFAGLLASSALGFLIFGIVGFLALGFLLELTSVGYEKSDVRWIGLGALYCAIPAIAFPVIREMGGFAPLMFLFVVVWATDIGAYFSGRSFGGAKLMPSISPKKTWSGAIGGLICAVVVALLFSSVIYLPIVVLVLSAAVLSVASQAGDLFESGIKRYFNVKDSSQLIPGHGGFLDRLDGLVAAAVPFAIVVALSVR